MDAMMMIINILFFQMLTISLAATLRTTTTTDIDFNISDINHRTFCSKTDSNFCFTVFSGTFDFETAERVCSSQGGMDIDVNNQSMINNISSILADSHSSISLVVNARRYVLDTYMVDYDGNFYTHKGSGQAIVVQKSSFWYSYDHAAEMWDTKYRILCKRKNCDPNLSTCYFLSETKYDWFKGRRICSIFNSTFVTNVDKAKSLRLDSDGYWIGISSFSWRWSDSKWFSKIPEWSEEYDEDISTSCASIKINQSNIEWQARNCKEEAYLSVICKFNDSYSFFDSSQTLKKGKVIMITIIIMASLTLLLGTAFCIYIFMIRSIKRKFPSNDKKSPKRYSEVKRNQTNNKTETKNINYPKLELHNLEDSLEAKYETIPSEDQSAIYVNTYIDHTYSNVDNKTSVYSLGKDIYATGGPEDATGGPPEDATGGPPEDATGGPRSPTSPVTLVDNDLYDKKKSSIRSMMKLFRKKSSLNSDESTSTYEPLSPVSIGRRSAPNLNPSCGDQYSLETSPFDDYARMISCDKEMEK